MASAASEYYQARPPGIETVTPMLPLCTAYTPVQHADKTRVRKPSWSRKFRSWPRPTNLVMGFLFYYPLCRCADASMMEKSGYKGTALGSVGHETGTIADDRPRGIGRSCGLAHVTKLLLLCFSPFFSGSALSARHGRWFTRDCFAACMNASDHV